MGEGGSLTPTVVVLLMLVRIAVFVVVGFTIPNALVHPVNTVDPADPYMLFPLGGSLVSVMLQSAPNLLPTITIFFIMPPPLRQMMPTRRSRCRSGALSDPSK